MGKVIAGIAAVLLIIGAFFFFDVEQTQEAELPNVDVEVTGGQAPEYDVEAGDIEVGTTTIEVPTVDLESPEEERAEGEAPAETEERAEAETETETVNQ